MYFFYGGYTHPRYEVNLEKFERFALYTERNGRWAVRHRLTFSGELQYYGQADITAAIDQLEQAYNNDRNGDIGLLQDDGTRTPHCLSDADSINGVRIIYFDYPQGDAVEYATKRTFRCQAEAEYIAADENLFSFEETLSFVGNGGPMWDLETCAKGQPVYVQRAQLTPQQCVQRGRIVGLLSYMSELSLLPPPVFATGEHQDQRLFSQGEPEHYGNMWLKWPENYEYHYTFGVDSSANATPTVL